MVTQQSWMFQRSHAAIRKDVLEGGSLSSVVLLGPRAFEEIQGAFVSVGAFSLRNMPARPDQLLIGFRLADISPAIEKQRELLKAVANVRSPFRAVVESGAFSQIPESPLIFWVREGLLHLLQSPRRLKEFATVHDGITTGDNERFLRLFWETGQAGRWRPYEKGGAYCKWRGLQWFVIDWGIDGAEVRAHEKSFMRNERLQFTPGLTYNLVAQGAMAARLTDGAAFDPQAH